MTSKHLFFKMMKEDLRHRVWMIVMSILAGLLLPVMWLIYRENVIFGNAERWFWETELYVGIVKDFLKSETLIMGGVVGICGALIAALAGFRFVFHRDQVDTWHSLPVRRDMLFGVCYLNGALIWLLPLLAGVVLTGVLSGRLLTGGGDLTPFADVLRLALKIFGLWAVVFSLVYNLALTAMMFSGNVLNTIVSMLILGIGAICCFTLSVGLHSCYLETYLPIEGTAWTGTVYASPLVSAWALLLDRREMLGNFHLWIYGLEAVALGSCAWLLYRRRPSELSEQGIRCRALTVPLQLVTTAGAGVGGWLFFYALANEKVVWAVFGGLLAVVLAHGILNVVFRMEFRAFFARKVQLGGVTAAVLLTCFCFKGDWLGYDSYCPEKEEIAEVGLLVDYLTNRPYGGVGDPLLEMQYRDKETAYAFLREVSQEGIDRTGPSESVQVRVTLKNGRTYYRRYRVSEAEKELLMPIIASPEYMEKTYGLYDWMDTDDKILSFHMEQGTAYFGEDTFTREELEPLFQAYNQDVLEEPETVLLGQGRVLAEANMSFWNNYGYRATIELKIYETMNRTIQVLGQMGYEKLVSVKTAAEIASIELGLNDRMETDSPEKLIEAARKRYGVPASPGGTAQETSAVLKTDSPGAEQKAYEATLREPALSVREPGEVEELLSLISYTRDDQMPGFLKRSMVSVKLTDKDGEQSTGYIRKGDLPEKYILRFGELANRASSPVKQSP